MKKITFLMAFVMLTLGLSAQVFITELADPNNNAGVRYIELYNAGATDVDFTEGTGWRIDKYTNASASVSQTLALTGTIPAGGFYIIATGTDDGDFLAVYSVSADQFDGQDNHVAGSNGDDNLELYDGTGALVDQFGVPGEDGTNTAHEFEDGRAERVASVTSGNPTWDVLEWTIDNDGALGDGPQDAPNGFDPRSWIGQGAPVPSITWNTSVFTEDAANDGSFSNLTPMVIDLANETFAETMVYMTENMHYTVANLPAGLGLQIISAVGTSANITLTGNATNHADADDISDLTITFLDAAFVGGDASVVTNSSKSDIAIDFMDAPDPKELTWSTITFTEAVANDGTIGTTIDLALVSELFTTLGTLAEGTDYNVLNLPSGLSIDITTSTLSEGVITLTGAADAHADADDISDLTIEFLDAAFVGADASALINYSINNIAIDFIDPYIVPDLMITEIMYNSPSTDTLEFIEIYNKESSDVNLNGFTMLGVTHTFGDLVIPANDYLVLCIDSTAMLNVFGLNVYEWTSGGLSNGGEAVAIYTAEGLLVDSISYDDNASWPDSDGSGHSLVACTFGGNDVASQWFKSATYVTDGLWASPMAEDNFCSMMAYIDWGTGIFTEAVADDGSIANSLTITLTGDEFTTVGTLVEGTDYNVTNVPTGLTVEIVTNTTTEAVVSLTGNADSHLDSDDISDMEIAFTDDAFLSDYSGMIGHASKTDLVVDFSGILPVSLTWNATSFNESAANDGTIGNTISVTLENEAFAYTGEFVYGMEYDYSNLPAGLTLVVTVTSATEATIELQGTADSHLDADDVNNFTIDFWDIAYVGQDASIVTNTSNSTLVINFDDPAPTPELTWNEAIFYEATVNDGSVDNTLSASLTAETFATVGVLVEGTDYIVSGVPAGLTLNIETTSATEAVLSLTGMADNHEALNSTNVMSVEFTNVAYTGGDASAVENNQNPYLGVIFIDPYIVPELVITEIMYNSPESGTDSLEFIEIYNNGTEDVQLENYYMAGVNYTFPNTLIQPGNYLVISVSYDALWNTFGIMSSEWTSGGLSNSGEGIAIYNPGGALVDTVGYDDGTWPSTDGGGHSLVLCDYDSDNNDPSNWLISTVYVTYNADGDAIFASPSQQDAVCSSTPELTWDVYGFIEDAANDGSIETVANLEEREREVRGREREK